MNTVTAKRELLENCRDPEYREALVFENVYTGLSSQIRVLREQRELSQAALGRKVNMAQERISILEDPNAETKPTLTTLLRVASGFDLGLDVRFVSFGTVLDRSVETTPGQSSVPSFEQELPGLAKQLEEAESILDRSVGDSLTSSSSKAAPVPAIQGSLEFNEVSGGVQPETIPNPATRRPVSSGKVINNHQGRNHRGRGTRTKARTAGSRIDSNRGVREPIREQREVRINAVGSPPNVWTSGLSEQTGFAAHGN